MFVPITAILGRNIWREKGGCATPANDDERGNLAFGLGAVTWSPLGGGMLTGKYRKGQVGRAEGFGGRVFRPENSAQRSAVLDVVLEIAKEAGTTADRVAIAWAGSRGGVPLIGPRTLEQLRSNLPPWISFFRPTSLRGLIW
ncbi:hypothetical protein BH10PLA2_BH10PLA2_35660 [soil metagenome]